MAAKHSLLDRIDHWIESVEETVRFYRYVRDSSTNREAEFMAAPAEQEDSPIFELVSPTGKLLEARATMLQLGWQLVGEFVKAKLEATEIRRVLNHEFFGAEEQFIALWSDVKSRLQELVDRGGAAPAKCVARRRASPRKPTPLTAAQTEAMQLVGEHKGNFAAAAKAAGKSRTMMIKLYEKATAKLGKKAVKHLTQRLPTDHRGQEIIAAEEEE